MALPEGAPRIDVAGSNPDDKTNPPVPSGSVNWYQICLDRTRHSLAYQLAMASHCVRLIRLQMASKTFRTSRMRGVSYKEID